MEKYINIHLSFLCSIVLLHFICRGHVFCYASEGDSSRIAKFTSEHIRENTRFNMRKYVGISAGPIFSVIDYGAKGDGTTDDTSAFLTTLKATCEVKDGVLVVPPQFTLLLQPLVFDGTKCQSNITIQVDGKIVAPSNISEWSKIGHQWILLTWFTNGISINGNGVIDGNGAAWWKAKNYIPVEEGFRDNHCPHALLIANSSDISMTGITIQNSPMMHLFISNSQRVNIFNLTISSPGNSPNTDGIHLVHTQHVIIHNSSIASGDDCVSIQTGCSDIKILEVNCGPGHGFSIGSLGIGKTNAYVSNVAIYNSIAHDTSIGLRIKAWPGASGMVQNITYSNITMSNVKVPIIVDQYYCNGHDFCNSTDTNAVSISGVTYENIVGTFLDKPICFVCNSYNPCSNILMSLIDLEPARVNATGPYCLNAYGELRTLTTPLLVDCLMSPILPPASAPIGDPSLLIEL